MSKLLAAVAAVAFVATQASAQTLLTDNFNAENGGNSALNYSGFANWNVTGQVDLVRSGDFGITCAGGSGSCVDLDGSSGPGRISTKTAFSFGAGDVVRIAFDFSGSQRTTAADDITVGASFGVNTQMTSANFAFGSLTGTLAGGLTTGYAATGIGLPSAFPWSFGFLEFLAAASGSVTFSLETSSADNVGPLVDNMVITRRPATVVPEPSTYALLATGLAGLAVAARRRRA